MSNQGLIQVILICSPGATASRENDMGSPTCMAGQVSCFYWSPLNSREADKLTAGTTLLRQGYGG